VTVYSPLSPVSAAVYTALNVAALTALATGGVHDDVPQGTSYPFVLFTVAQVPMYGLGARAGSGPGGTVSQIDLRVHVYTQDRGFKTAQAIIAKVTELLQGTLTMTGYSSRSVFDREAIPFPDEVVSGVKVKELVKDFTLFVEET
jgi:hypothetical protein